MENANSVEKKEYGLLKWGARIWSLPAIIFMVGELLFPHSEPGIHEKFITYVALGILFVSVFSLALGWFRELAGGWLSLGSLVLFLLIYWISEGRFFPSFWLLLLGIAAPAGLFLLYDYLRKPQTV